MPERGQAVNSDQLDLFPSPAAPARIDRPVITQAPAPRKLIVAGKRPAGATRDLPTLYVDGIKHLARLVAALGIVA